MADIVINVRPSLGAVTVGDDVEYSGVCRLSGMNATMESMEWTATASPGALAATVNAAIKDAAIAVAVAAGFTVGVLDKKTLLGGAIGL